ncbi:MAG: glycosyltransferase family 4 protein [Armatimonadetes bacterium]|nr:glycosyltransferase family 4 protein [Armatimonadota bacterium]
MRTVLLISTEDRPADRCEAASGRRPTPDYHALADALGATILDRAAATRALPPALRRGLRRGAAWLPQVAAAFLRRHAVDRFVCDSERLGLPLCALLAGHGSPPVYFIAHRVTARWKRALLRWPGVRRQIGGVFCYAGVQAECLSRLGLPAERIHRIAFHADAHFFRPDGTEPERLVRSVGRERRDYATLAAAAARLDCPVRILARSPWSRQRGDAAGPAAGGNVSFLPGVSYPELRDLYRRARVVAVPVAAVDFQAGITALLEAMAMARPVVATANPGLKEAFADGEAGLWVPPGDAVALARALNYLLDHPVEAAAMGRRGRELVEQGMTLAHWVARITRVVQSP